MGILFPNSPVRVIGGPEWLRFAQGGASAPASWWLSGGISAANCVAAYQPKGAASLAASYSNLNNPGTNDAAPGVAPTLSSGWVFNGSSWLDTGITPVNNQTWSMFVQFSGFVSAATWKVLAGEADAAYSASLSLWLSSNGDAHRYYDNSGEKVASTGPMSAGNMGVAGTTGYRDGASDATSIPIASGTPVSIQIGRLHSVSTFYPFAGTIQALAIYNATLSAAQAAALATAMAAL